MQTIGAVGMVVFVVTCAAVGVKLLALALRGGGLPAGCCGLAFSLIAFLGYPLPVIAGLGQGTVGELNMPLLLVGNWASTAGICCFFVFTQQVFRPGVPWAQALAVVLIAAYVGVTAANTQAFLTVSQSADSLAVNRDFALAIQLLCLACFVWIGAEGLYEWQRSRRRVALRLGDPVVSNRFLMWGLFGVSTSGMIVVLIGMTLVHINTATSVVGPLTMAGFGLISSTFAALAFFPPESYLARIRAAA